MPEVEYIFYGTPENFCAVAEKYVAMYRIAYELIHEGSSHMVGNQLVRRGTGIVLNDEIAIRGIGRADGTTTRLEISFNPDSTSPQAELKEFLESFLERLRRDGWQIIRVAYSDKSIESVELIESTDTHSTTDLIGQDDPQQLPDLTDRLKEVLKLAHEGKNRGEIANLLSIGAETVDGYVQDICEKLNLPQTTKSLSTLLKLLNQRGGKVG